MNSFKLSFLIASVFCLVGCKHDYSQNYLMQHPYTLKKEVARCQKMTTKTSEELNQCDMVAKADEMFMAIYSSQQSEPEKFGQTILEAEASCRQAKNDLDAIQKTIADLKAQKISADNLANAETKLAEAKKKYHDESARVKIYMAVMSLSSPE